MDFPNVSRPLENMLKAENDLHSGKHPASKCLLKRNLSAASFVFFILMASANMILLVLVRLSVSWLEEPAHPLRFWSLRALPGSASHRNSAATGNHRKPLEALPL